MEKWNGIMKVLELEHVGLNGHVLHREENLLNIIHSQGEDLILRILFSGQVVPENYYIGLDFRSVLDRPQTIADLFGWEPTTNAYSRQAVKSDNFSVVTMSSGRQANSPTLLFRASGGSWGPVRNIFLSTALGYGTNSVLISSVPLSTSITVADGEVVTMRMAMALSGC